MKKRILSSLLMGALFVASMSMFTSCKDYDDDINSNTASIEKLQTQLTTLQTALDQAKSDAATAHATYALKSDVTSLQTEIAKLATAESLQTAIADLKTLINAKVSQSDYDAEVKKISGEIDAINSTLNELPTTLNKIETAYEAADKNLQAQIDVLNTFKANATNATTGYQAQIDALTKSLTAAQDSISSNKTTIAALTKKMNELSTGVDKFSSNVNILTVFVKRNLSSLVLKPAAYYGGIESVEVLNDSSQTYKEADKSLTWFKLDKVMTLSGIGVAEYHVNPTTADLANRTVAFYSNVAGVYDPITRAAGDVIATPVYTKTDSLLANKYFANGILSIPFTANFDAINANLKASKGSFIAAQISAGDTTVTSDYAMVVPKTIYNLLVCDNTFKTTGHDDVIATPNSGHLHKMFSDLAKVATPATHDVAYNSSIDLTAITETHYTSDPKVGTDSTDATVATAKCNLLDAATFKALGLKYVFKTVTYTLGSNKTDETAHIELVTDPTTGHVIAYPRNVKADGTTIKNETANASSVGRMPIILVEVVDAKGNIYAYGYTKLKITDVTSTPKDITADEFPLGDYYLDCQPVSDQLTWAEVEYNLYNVKLGISKATFDATYTFDGGTPSVTTLTDGTKWATVIGTQYFAADKASLRGTTAKPNLGTITEEYNVSDIDATTHVLKWTFTANDYKALVAEGVVKNGVNTKAITVYVRYANKNAGGDLYVPLTIAAGKFHFATGKIDNTKTLSYWYEYQSQTNAADASKAFEVRANVPVPTPKDNVLTNTEFVKDLHDYFLNGKLSVLLNESAKYPKLAAMTLTPEFEFTLPVKDQNADFSADANKQWTVNGYSGNVYTLQLNANLNEIQVAKVGANAITPVTIVKLEDDAANVQSKMTYVEGEYADDILNYVDHAKLGSKETFTAYIKIVSNDGCYPIELDQPYFNVRFLRPLTLGEAAPYEIKDAPNDYQYIPFTSLVGVTDWRDYVGDPSNTTGGAQKANAAGTYMFDYTYYGVKFTAATDKIMTDANLGASARKASTDANYLATCVNASNIVGLKLAQTTHTFTTGGTAVDVLSYINNNANTGTYHLFVPIKMTYVFGNYTNLVGDPDARQSAYAIITVTKTEGNAKRN